MIKAKSQDQYGSIIHFKCNVDHALFFFVFFGVIVDYEQNSLFLYNCKRRQEWMRASQSQQRNLAQEKKIKNKHRMNGPLMGTKRHRMGPCEASDFLNQKKQLTPCVASHSTLSYTAYSSPTDPIFTPRRYLFVNLSYYSLAVRKPRFEYHRAEYALLLHFLLCLPFLLYQIFQGQGYFSLSSPPPPAPLLFWFVNLFIGCFSLFSAY